MTVDIAYSDVFSFCQSRSAYDSREPDPKSGQVNYLHAHITEQDRTLIDSYSEQAAQTIISLVGGKMLSVVFDADKVQFLTVPLDSNRSNISSVGDMLKTALEHYVLHLWYIMRLPTIADSYSASATAICVAVAKILHTKNKPVLSNY